MCVIKPDNGVPVVALVSATDALGHSSPEQKIFRVNAV